MKLESREEILNFIMAAAEQEEQELDFHFEEDDIENALHNVREVARVALASSPEKKRRRKSYGGKKRGPKPSKVAITSYHLPEMSKIPKNFKPQNAEVIRHMENGYGFRKIDSKGPCPDSLVVTDNAEDFSSYLHSTHPMLKEEDYFLYRLSKGRKLVELNIKTTREFSLKSYFIHFVYLCFSFAITFI